MSDTDANIRINIETAKAQAQLRALQTQVATLQKTMAGTSMANMGVAGAGLAASMPQLKGFNNEIVTMASNTKLLDKSLAGASRGISDSFTTMRQSITKTGTAYDLAVQKANLLNRKYKEVGRNLDGMSTVVRSSPIKSMATDSQIATQRLSIFNRALQQGSTSILNWGKNMQWAGRQLMVGFTVPLTIAAGLAAKAFMDLEREVINFKRVYGDFDTSINETNAMADAVQELAIEMTRLGFTAKETTGLAADAAATGLVGDELLNVTRQATNLATLGMISQDQALNTMISLNSAFKIQGQELEDTVNFLNAVENQTVLALSDVTESIPLVAPVIQGLGGDIQDLAVMLTAMREGGIGANEAANALKTSLARLITPAKAARDRAGELGINLNAIVEDNEGDLMGMINSLAQAMEGLSDLDTQKLLSDLFGKRQFARMGALFTNIADDASQAQRVIELTTTSTAELAALADRELGEIAGSSTMRFTSALEQLKVAIAPIGEAVLKLITPVLEFGTKVANWFNDLGDNAKKALGFLTVGIGVVIPGLVMFIGLMGNLTGILLKGFQTIMNLVPALRNLGGGAEYLSNEQLEAANAAAQLNTQESVLNSTLSAQATIVGNLVGQYNALATSMRGVPGGAGPAGKPPVKMATGGNVPGSGTGDRVPALLTPGEFVVKKSQADKHRGFLSALNGGSVKGFNEGGSVQVGGRTVPVGFDIGALDTRALEKKIAKALEWGVSEADIERIIAQSVEQGVTQGMSSKEGTKQVSEGMAKELGREGLGSRQKYNKDGELWTEKSHVMDPIRLSTKEVDAYAESIRASGDQATKAGKAQLELIDAVGASNVKVEQLGDAVLDLPSAVNQSLKGGGQMSGKAAKTALLDPDVLANTFNTQKEQWANYSTDMNLSQQEIDSGFAQIDAAQAEYEQHIRNISDDAIVVEQATTDLGENTVALNKVYEKSTQNTKGAFKEFQNEIKKGGKNIRLSLTEEGKRIAKAKGFGTKSDGVFQTSHGKVANRRTSTAAGALPDRGRRGNSAGVTNYQTVAMTQRGKAAAQAYEKGLQQELKGSDPYLAARDRNSPHPQAAIDGADDADSYEASRRAALEGSDPYTDAKQSEGLAGSPSQSNKRLEALQNKRAGTTQQAIVADQKVVAASNRQVAAQNRFATVTNVASAAMTNVAKGAKGFGKALLKGSGKLSAATGAMTGVVFAASMIPGPLQELSQQIMPATFGLMAVQQLLPLLKNPWVALAAAVVAAGVGIWYLNKTTQEAAEASAKYAKTMMGAREDIQKYSDQFGNLSNIEKEAQRKVQRETGESVDEESLSEAKGFIEAEVGKELIERVKSAQSNGGADEAARSLAQNLARQIGAGTISESLANAISYEVANAVGDQDIAIDSIMNVNEILGPNGNDYLKDPLRITTELLTSGWDMEEAMNNAGLQWDGLSWYTQVFMIAKGDGTVDLFAPQAAESAIQDLKIIEEGEAAIAEALATEAINAEEAKNQFAELAKLRSEYSSNDALKEAQTLYGDDWGDDQTIQFQERIIDSFKSSVNMELGKEKGEEFVEGINKATDDNLAAVDFLDPKSMETAKDQLENSLALWETDLGMAMGRDDTEGIAIAKAGIEEINGSLKSLRTYAEDLPNALNAVSSGLIDIEEGMDIDDLIGKWKEYKEEIPSAQWLMGQLEPEKPLYEAIFGDDALLGMPEEKANELKENMTTAMIEVTQAGGDIDDLFAMMDGDLQATAAAAKEFGHIFSEEFDNLPKKQQTDFILNFATDTLGWSDELVAWFEAQDPNTQKEFLLTVMTKYEEYGTPSAAMALADDDPWTARWIHRQNPSDLIRQGETDDDGKDPAPTKTPPTSSGSSGGSEPELDWLEQLLEDTKESKILYGKIVEEGKGSIIARKGYIQWLREKTGLTEEAIQELAKDKEARDRFKEMSKAKRDEYVQKSNNNAFRKERDDVRAREEEEAKKGTVQDELGDTLLSQTIQGNETLLTLYNGTNAEKKKATELGQRIVNLDSTQIDQQKKINDQIKQQNDYLLSQMKVSKMVTSMAIERAALGGKTLNDLQVDNNVYNKEAAWIRATQIEPQEELIEGQQDLIDGYEREIDKVQEVIDGYEREVEHKQRKIDLMNREDELRMRESDMLSHDLKLMGYQEETINDTYNARIDALTKVQQINQNIAKSQQTQLGLSDALSRGDIGAAAQAAAQMQSEQADFAAQAFSSSLETARDSAVNSLTGQDSGLTRDQIDDRQRVLEEQSYQNKLATLAISDEIYNIQEKIYGQEVLIEAQEVLISEANKNILGYQDQIALIEDGRLKTIEDIVKENDKQLAFAEWQIAAGTAEHDKAIGRAEQEFKALEDINNLELKSLEIEEAQGVQIKQNLDLMNSFGKATARAMKAIKSGEFDPVKYSEKVGKQSAALAKQMSSISFDATKYEGMIGPKTTASFNVSQTASPVSSGIMGGIAGNVTNNFMNNSVRVDAAGANANEVADIVIRRLEIDKTKNTGG